MKTLFIIYVFATLAAVGAEPSTHEYEPNLKISTPKSWQKAGVPAVIDKSKKDKGPYKLLSKYFSGKAKSKEFNQEDMNTFIQLLAPAKGETEIARLGIYMAFTSIRKSPYAKDILPVVQARFDKAPDDEVVFWAAMLGDLKDASRVARVLELYAKATNSEDKKFYGGTLREMGYEVPFEEDKPKPATSGKK
ncbi:hypothetical protein BH11VER1_BH11VER1_34730 [soil metagenome]